MRIDRLLCQRGDLCRLLAPEVGDGRHVPVTPDTLAAMAACPTGALGWREEDDPRDD
jgi:ferredoxin